MTEGRYNAWALTYRGLWPMVKEEVTIPIALQLEGSDLWFRRKLYYLSFYS